MEQRIRDFEPLWLAINGFLPRPLLVRSTNEHHLLPDAELVQWHAAGTQEERDAIIAANAQVIYLDQEFVLAQEHYRGPAPLDQDPLDYYDPDADEVYDLEYAAY